jgi:adenylate cyclase class 2
VLEVEVKYRVDDPAAVVARLGALGADRAAERTDADHYFNAPDRDFQQTDEAFRLRRIGAENRLTYKGPKREAATKTRTEIEVRLADGDAAAADTGRMLVSLGYRPVAVVRKRRTVYHLTRGPFAVEVCADDVDRVGSFVEVEVVAEEARFEEAKAAVLALAAELGLTHQERRSYLEMLLETEQMNGREEARKET